MKPAFPARLVGDELAIDVTAEAGFVDLARSKGCGDLGKVCVVGVVDFRRRGVAGATGCPLGLEHAP